MLLINKKYYFINNLKNHLLNNNYLFFFNNKINNLNYKILELKNLQSCDIKKLNLNKNFFLRKNSKLLALENLNNLNLETKDINFISYKGYIINNNYKNKLLNYNLFYNSNFKLFIFIILLKINNLKLLLFFIIYKIIHLINIKIKNKLKIN